MATIPGPQNLSRAPLAAPRRVMLDDGGDAIGAGLQRFGAGVTQLGGRLQQREAAQARARAAAEQRAQAVREADARSRVEQGAVGDAHAEAQAIEAFDSDLRDIVSQSRRRDDAGPSAPSAFGGAPDDQTGRIDIAGEFGRRSTETIDRLIQAEPDPAARARRADRLNRLRLVFAADAAGAAQTEADRAAESAVGRSLDAFEAGIGREPARFPLLAPLAVDAIDDPAARLSPERRDALKAEFRGRAMRAAIQGIARNDPAQARDILRRGSLDEGGAHRIADALSPAQIAEQRRLVDIYAEDASRRAAEDQARAAREAEARDRQTSAALARAIDSGAAGPAEIEAARLSGELSDATRNALGARVVRRSQRLADEEAAIALVRDARATGRGLDAADPAHARAADGWWESVIKEPFLQTRPADRPAFLESALDGLGVVPAGAARATAAMWRSGDPDQQIAAAPMADLVDRLGRGPLEATTLPYPRRLDGPNPRNIERTLPNHPSGNGVPPGDLVQTLPNRYDPNPADIPEPLRSQLDRAMREHPSPATDLFHRHERLTQRLALDLADIGIPPPKAIQQAEAHVAKLADAVGGGAGGDGPAGGSGTVVLPVADRREGTTTGAFGRVGGKIAKSLDQNRADARSKDASTPTDSHPVPDPEALQSFIVGAIKGAIPENQFDKEAEAQGLDPERARLIRDIGRVNPKDNPDLADRFHNAKPGENPLAGTEIGKRIATIGEKDQMLGSRLAAQVARNLFKGLNRDQRAEEIKGAVIRARPNSNMTFDIGVEGGGAVAKESMAAAAAAAGGAIGPGIRRSARGRIPSAPARKPGPATEGDFASKVEFDQFQARRQSGIPLGVATKEEAQALTKSIKEPLENAGVTDAKIAIRGSAVTGRKFNAATGKYDGPPFDHGRTSDYDIAIISPSLLQKARELNIPIRGGGKRTIALGKKELAKLGLPDLPITPQSGSKKRKVSYMIYGSEEAVSNRGAFANLQ